MITSSEYKLFFQSALAMAGFLLFLTMVGWAYQPRATSTQVPIVAIELHK